jgi:hypothetical protein
MASKKVHSGPHDVWITIEYSYNNRKYLTKQRIVNNENNKVGPDLICFDPALMQRIIDALDHGKKIKNQNANGAGWDQNNELNKPIDFGEQPPPDRPEHTPICWHQPGCTYWCADS